MTDNKEEKPKRGKAGLSANEDSNIIVVNKADSRSVEIPETLPVLPFRNATLFPNAVLPVAIGRQKSAVLVEEVNKTHGLLVAATQIESDTEDPTTKDLYKTGVVAQIIKALRMPDGTQTIVFQGIARIEIIEEVQTEPFLVAKIKRASEGRTSAAQKEAMPALMSSLRDLASEMFTLQPNTPTDTSAAVKQMHDDDVLVSFVSSNMEASSEDKNSILICNTVYKRAERLLAVIQKQLEFLRLKANIQTKAKQNIDKQQREYMLQQQLRTIQDELGGDPQKILVEKYRKQAQQKKWDAKVAEAFEAEIEKVERINPNSPEYGLTLSYLDTLIGLPWNEYSEDNLDLQRAEDVLNEGHYGLDKVKERIIEHLAVLKLKGDLKSPILCLYGPPGVGKTSLGKSIAEALGRKYVRISLGGMHDEAEIRGHRRTYVGAMPGRIIEGLRNAGTANPVFILDEIDKVSNDFHGDPAAALLEVLDPEQNMAFHDNFLDLDFDLSHVMFIATANNTGTISGPLLDRMEMIGVDGYLLEEKVEIAKSHLIPKAKENHGLQPDTFDIQDDVVAYIVDKYTRESGVRQLAKVIASLCRKMALKVAKGDTFDSNLSKEAVHEMLGIEKFDHDIWHDDLRAGVVTGLAWTAVGGEILFVECAASKGKGKMTLTGNLGDVMKESAVLALEYVRSNAKDFGLQDIDFDETNFHIHVPEGAVPKDGPSAGVTMVTAIVSALTGRRVRKRIAMTGEITLRGMVIPVGGITEKILAAKRAGITDIILCKQNKKDIDEIKKEYVEGLTFHFVDRIAEVISIALEDKPENKE